ncbi:MAG: PilZ domain-containing protein [Bacillota bacterium]
MGDYVKIEKESSIKLSTEMAVELTGQIYHVEEDWITFETNYDLNMDKQSGIKALCYVSNPNTTVHSFMTEIVEIDHRLIKIKNPMKQKIDTIEKRQQIRLEMNLNITCYIRGFQNKEIVCDKYIPSTVKDLSAGGALLHSQLSLPKQTVVVTELPLGAEEIMVTLEVLRSDKREDGFYMGCKFLRLDRHEEHKIMKTVLKGHLKKTKQAKNRK